MPSMPVILSLLFFTPLNLNIVLKFVLANYDRRVIKTITLKAAVTSLHLLLHPDIHNKHSGTFQQLYKPLISTSTVLRIVP